MNLWTEIIYLALRNLEDDLYSHEMGFTNVTEKEYQELIFLDKLFYDFAHNEDHHAT